ncbi:MAG: ribonuclease R [Desulfuromonas sp.]|nr:MAG: ribonuclease R [Desulfuromonas sp.]
MTGIVERSRKMVVGSYQQGRDHDFILPIDASFSRPIPVYYSGGIRPEAGEWVAVKFSGGAENGGALRGEVVDILGDPSDPKVEMMAAACRFSIPIHFPPEILAAAEAVPDRVSTEELEQRADLRAAPFITIDGEDARDFDDAVHVRRKEGGFRLYVAIADVSHYVPPGSLIDSEAFRRGTSVYFPGYCIPMLPEQLSNEICSLRPDVDRLVLVAEMVFDVSGHRTASKFYPAVINSQARMTYNSVQGYLDDEAHNDDDDVPDHLAQLPVMSELAQILEMRRHERGSLELDIPEPEVMLDRQGQPEAIRFARRLQSHRLIEEFMLASNEAVATFLDGQKQALPFRIHEPPDQDDFSALNAYLKTHARHLLTFDHDLHSELQKLVAALEDPTEKRIVSRLLLQSMKQARYSIENVGHYGLAADKYCHFTSPIRRYPDLAVHRLLKQNLARQEQVYDKEALASIAVQSSTRERLAVDAERDVQAMLSCRFMEGRVGLEFPGAISSVQKFGLFVELDEFPVEGLVHIARLEEDYYHFDAETNRLIGERIGQIFSVGMPVKISVESVNIARREIDFTLASTAGKKKFPAVPRKGRRRRR